MNGNTRIKAIAVSSAILFGAFGLTACNSMGPNRAEVMQVCPQINGHDLDQAFQTVRQALTEGCQSRFHSYLNELLSVAEGDPKPENKQKFSEFLEWANREGLISKRQARNIYNRYFNVKFVSLLGDFNTCSQACPAKQDVMADMAQELSDKERGLLKISADTDNFYRADQLFNETELVLEATCAACSAER